MEDRFEQESSIEMYEMFRKMGLSKNKKIKEFNIDKMFTKFVLEILKNWNYSQQKDEWRPHYANVKHGGIDFNNKEVTALVRSTGWELVKQIGKKLISGDFNLTTISIPLKVMVPLTILQGIARSMFSYPIYFGLASQNADPLEKFKFVIVASMSPYHKSSHFLKPMNPILGETYELLWQDGSRIYLEQTSHHPPVSHYIMYGPNNSYKFHGLSNFSSNAGLNSLKVTNKGKRQVEFNDGTKIEYNFCYESYSNSFWGTIRHESLGEIVYKDLTNGYVCVVKFGSVKRKPTDFFMADIKLNNNVVSKLYGSYLSFMEFDGVRYWDLREHTDIEGYEITNQPKSSSLLRPDRICLEEGRLDDGQVEKELLENLQRKDRKLRESHKKLKK